MPNDQFRDIVRLKPSLPISNELAPPMVSSLLKLAAQQSSQLTRYIGYYYEFRYSFTTTDLVLKTLIHVFESDGLVLYKSIERLRSHALENAETPAATGTDVFKHVGLLIQLGNRIHMLDY